MSAALFYRGMRLAGRVVFRLVSSPTILHAERARGAGAYLLAANHESPFDAALLIVASPRIIDWLSIVELFQHPLSRGFLSAMRASPLDRTKVDTVTVRTMVKRLRAGNVVGIFPEGGLRLGAESVLRGGALGSGVCKLAQLSGVPVVPCLVLGGAQFSRWQCWLPFARTRWVVAFGAPIFPRGAEHREAAAIVMAKEIAQAIRALHAEAKSATDAHG